MMPCYYAGPTWNRRQSFFELIHHGEDKDRLRSIINRSFATALIAYCLHVHMRDAYVSSVLVQLFISGLASSEDETIHMIGIRDLVARRPGKLRRCRWKLRCPTKALGYR